ncbi:MAG: hypothetical protein VKL39_06485 [Leptolyngbyaceae bacterium]|nr:hypothetical protein [Leptolyngbyaceae bacterium]
MKDRVESQVKSEFESVLLDALNHPEDINFSYLLEMLEAYLQEKTEHEQLPIAGKAFVQLTELHELRAERMLHAWEAGYSDVESEPIITDDMLAGLLRQSMSLDIEDILESTYSPRNVSSNAGESQDESVAGTVRKDDLLEVLQDVELKQQALSIAHDEHVSAWTEAIRQWITVHQRSVSFHELVAALQCRDKNLTVAKVWLGLLLGGYILEQRGEFYEMEGVWITLD